jgi:hypothetical protein
MYVVSWYLGGRLNSVSDLVDCLTQAASFVAGLAIYNHFMV